MLIYIVRHGETRANEEGLLQGWTNEPLNNNGKRLAEVTGLNMRDIQFDACISSPLMRAKETAEILLKASGNDKTPIILDNRIREIFLGDWENKHFKSGESEIDEGLLELFFHDPFHFPGCPNGENIQQVCDRTQDFLKELLRKDDDKTYLVTTHGFALRGMLNFLYDDPNDYWHGHVPYNCSVSIVKGARGSWCLLADDYIYYDLQQVVDHFKQ